MIREYILVSELKRQEGYKKFLYDDATGKPLLDTSEGKTTVGYGWNIEAGIEPELAEIILRYFMQKADSTCILAFDWYSNLSPARQEVVCNMVYNMGLDKFKQFKNTIQYIAKGEFDIASREMLKSKWADQVGLRAIELSNKLRVG